MTRILITRPLEDAEPLAALLTAAGYGVLIEPLLDIVSFDHPLPDLAEFQAVLFTSANGVRAFARAALPHSLAISAYPVITVGAATKAAALSYGFENVVSADGDVEEMARLVIGRCQPDSGALLQIAATERAGDLAGRLTDAGFVVRRDVRYRAQPAEALTPATVTALASGGIDVALLYSPRTARVLAKLLGAAGGSQLSSRVAAVCLSSAVAAAVVEGGLLWRAVRVACRPDQDALLDQIAD